MKQCYKQTRMGCIKDFDFDFIKKNKKNSIEILGFKLRLHKIDNVNHNEGPYRYINL